MTSLHNTLTENRYRRWTILAIAILLAVVAFAFRYGTNGDESTRIVSFNVLTKVSIVLFSIALAWNQIIRLTHTQYGAYVLGGIGIALLFFLIRPKAMTAVLPFIGVSLVVLLAITFLRDIFKPGRGR